MCCVKYRVGTVLVSAEVRALACIETIWGGGLIRCFFSLILGEKVAVGDIDLAKRRLKNAM